MNITFEGEFYKIDPPFLTGQNALIKENVRDKQQMQRRKSKMECLKSINHCLPSKILPLILSHFDAESRKTGEFVCKLWNQIIVSEEKWQVLKENFYSKKLLPWVKFMSDELIDAFGGAKKICALPILNTEKKIFYLKDDEITEAYYKNKFRIKNWMMDQTIMRGDATNPFISIKILEGVSEHPRCFTVYSSDPNTFDACISFTCSHGMFGYEKEINTQNIKKLISSGELKGVFEDDSEEEDKMSYCFKLPSVKA